MTILALYLAGFIVAQITGPARPFRDLEAADFIFGWAFGLCAPVGWLLGTFTRYQ